MSATVHNIIVVSDLHCGCQLGLMRPDGASLDEGGRATASIVQKKVWSWWLQFWDEWVPHVTKGEEYDVVINGDIVDGQHHGSTSQWSHNPADQGKAAFDILEDIAKAARKFYVIRGTEAHAGISGNEEERLASALGAERGPMGNYSRWDLWKKMGPHLFHFAHHIGFTSSAAHETSAVNAELSLMFTASGKSGDRPPTIAVRSHRHMCCEVRFPDEKYYTGAFCTPAWQLRTPFSFRVARGRCYMPQVGGALIRLGDEELHTRFFIRNVKRDKPE